MAQTNVDIVTILDEADLPVTTPILTDNVHLTLGRKATVAALKATILAGENTDDVNLNVPTPSATTLTIEDTNSTGSGTTLPAATATTAGIMSAADKAQLDTIPAGGIDGSETIIQAGTNATLSGAGTTADPYIIGATGGGGGSLTDAQIKTAYENNANTNEFSDAEQTKLAGITNVGSGQIITAAERTALAAAEANVNADWNAVTGDAEILNKPTTITPAQASALAAATTDIAAIETAQTAQDTAIALNTAKVSAGGSIDVHSDVDTTTAAPAANQVLAWDDATSMWLPTTISAASTSYGVEELAIANSNFMVEYIGDAPTLTNPSAGVHNIVVPLDTLINSIEFEGNNANIDGSGNVVIVIDNSANGRNKRFNTVVIPALGGNQNRTTDANEVISVAGNVTTISVPSLGGLGTNGGNPAYSIISK